MRFHSTPESALNGEITILGIIETVVAVGLYLWAGLHLGTFKYLALAVVSAPLMLFRTRESAEWGLHLYRRWSNYVVAPERLPLIQVPAVILMGFAGSLIRLLSVLRGFVRSPVQTLIEAPQNWVRQSVCTDLFHPPEVVPLEALPKNQTEVWSLLVFRKIVVGAFTKLAATKAGWGDTAIDWISYLIFVALLGSSWIPSLIYRVSFKATAIAYAPIIWLVHSTLQNPLSLKLRLERVTKGEIEKTRRGLSWIIAGMLAAKLAFVLGWIDRAHFEAAFPSAKLVETIFAASHWPWWQITLATDALLTFLLLYFADAALARLDTKHAWSEPFVLHTLSTTSFLRGAFSLATMSHFFLLALGTAFPRLSFHLWSA
jgi:hypothetical protein